MTAVRIYSLTCEGFNGTGVVVGDETGTGSLWLDWEHHGEINVSSDDMRQQFVEVT